MTQSFILTERHGFSVVAGVLAVILAITAHGIVRPAGSSALEIAARAAEPTSGAAGLPAGLRSLEQPRWQARFFNFDDNAKGVAAHLQRRRGFELA
jgi:hypothetical protein